MSLQYVYSMLRLLLIVTLIFVSLFTLYYISSLTYPFIIAIFIALFINPFVNLLESKAKVPRGFAVLIAILLLICLVIGILILLVAEIVTGTTYLAKVIPGHLDLLAQYLENSFMEHIMPLYNQLTYLFSTLDTSQQHSILTNIQNIGEQMTKSIGLFIKDFLENIPMMISWLPNAATVIIFSLLATFFISKDWYKFKAVLTKILPQKARSSGRTVFDELKKALIGFIRAQATLISITTTIVLIGLLILRVDYAITIALLIGLVDILPYLGTGLVFVPWIIYLSFSNNLPLAIGLGILYLIVLIQRQVMEPKVLSSNIGLDPLATLIALFIGYQLIGFLGLIAGPVVLVILKTLHSAGVYEDLWQFIVGKGR
ncbi:sporulation integral membrane protein YtvI [Metabacillus malikii]|uniref:Sporulation integral membrane protein YtvI n=1 Tax=Metabacillus malikii TaxID=1504265 RepID=A0ABT9ZHJ3_9BACI|nr:sporulation integral membrane protein YtvI [Metabacillus malikii]MDQ0231018.1 sporulation integral membrane protein YtvI [Metabacillus malikii]